MFFVLALRPSVQGEVKTLFASRLMGGENRRFTQTDEERHKNLKRGDEFRESCSGRVSPYPIRTMARDPPAHKLGVESALLVT